MKWHKWLQWEKKALHVKEEKIPNKLSKIVVLGCIFVLQTFVYADINSASVCSNDFWYKLKPEYQKAFTEKKLPDIWFRQFKTHLSIMEPLFRKVNPTLDQKNQKMEVWFYAAKSDNSPVEGFSFNTRLLNDGTKENYIYGGEAYEFFSGKTFKVKEYISDEKGENSKLILENNTTVELVRTIFEDSSIGEYKYINSLQPSLIECIDENEVDDYNLSMPIRVTSFHDKTKMQDENSILGYYRLAPHGRHSLCRESLEIHETTIYNEASMKQDKQGNLVWKKIFVSNNSTSTFTSFLPLPDNTALLLQTKTHFDQSNGWTNTIARIDLCTGKSKAPQDEFVSLDADDVDRFTIEMAKKGIFFEMKDEDIKALYHNYAFPKIHKK